MLRRLFPGLLAFLFILSVPAFASAQTPDTGHIESAEEAAEEVRGLYQHRDFAFGAMLGGVLLERFPENEELRAWTLLHRAQHAGSHPDMHADRETAAEKAKTMTNAHPESPWGWFALAGTARFLKEREDEALQASKRALELAPDHADVAWMRSAVFNTLDRYEEAVAFADEHAERLDHPAPLLTSKLNALHHLIEDETELRARLQATFEAAVEADPLNPNVYYIYGLRLESIAPQAKSFPWIERAARMMPTSAPVLQRYWRAVQNHRDLSSEEKRERILASADALVEKRSNVPSVLLTAAGQYGQIGEQERQEELHERILEIAPDSREGEWALVNQYRAFNREHGEAFDDQPALRAEYRAMLEAFIDRPHHHSERLLGDAYRSLFYLVEDDPETDSDVLLEIVEGMAAYEGINPHITHGLGAIALAKHTDYYERARAIAEEGMERAGERIDGQREWGAYDSEEDYEQAWNWYIGQLRSALGWVYFHEGRLDVAEAELNRAYEMNRENADNLYRLGQLYEAQDQLEQAEVFYREGFAIETMADNPNAEALENLYQAMHGSLEGYEEYLAALRDLDQAERYETVLASRLDEPEALHAFTLETLDGDTISSAEYEGRILAINLWGKWCGPCVREMPDVQALYEKYAGDADVEILTINNDRDLDELRTWLDERDYSFPVLLDDGFLNEIEMHIFPTTWFVNPVGQIEFIKRGYTAELVEEFSWKIEAIRGKGD